MRAEGPRPVNVRDAGDHAGHWAITSYYNPVGYRRRRVNYEQFRRHLNVPLLTVELSHDGHFELSSGDADRLVHVAGGDVLWQKERLLNLAIAALPSNCRTVAWLDCDIVFERSDWMSRAVGLLDRFALVQPFACVLDVPPDAEPSATTTPRALCRRDSLAFQMAAGVMSADRFCRVGASAKHRLSPGMAWVAARETLAAHGLYDAAVLGGADKLMAAAAYGCYPQNGRAYRMEGRRLDHYCEWARPFWETIRGRVGYLDGNIFHLWHGDLTRRGYVHRHDVTHRFDFDPTRDIALTESDCWRWSSAKPGLHHSTREYFVSRREDG